LARGVLGVPADCGRLAAGRGHAPFPGGFVGGCDDTEALTGKRIAFLALAAFVVASDATLVAALLRQIAGTLSTSPAVAGLTVTVYAAGYALGAPLIIRAARRASQERLMAGSLSVFAAANAATAAAPSLAALLGARIAAGACGGTFMAAATATAAGSAAPGHRGRALAVIVGGSSAGTAFGVPLGTVAGGAIGWRPAFFGITAVAALSAAATAAFSPHQENGAAPAPIPIPLPTPRGTVLLTLATTLLWATGSFTFFTYVGVVLHHTASVGASGLAGFLLVFGLAGLAGAAASGWLTDKTGPLMALAGGLTLTALSLAGLGVIAAVTAGPAAVIASGAAIAGYGFGTWAITPPQQQRLLSSGGNDRLLLSFNATTLYAGVGLGGALGGLTLAVSHSTAAVCWTAAGIELAALTLVGRAASRKKLNPPGAVMNSGDVPDY
jgi:MFS transporter, DHA1 family, inner membrane transport protein